MALNTHSRFYFDYNITSDFFAIDFDEGGGEIQADVEIGSYTLTEVLVEVAAAMTDAGGQEYTVSVDRDTRLVTISAPGTFDLLVSSGTRVGQGVWNILGFTTVVDRTGATSYVADEAAGEEYTTQFKLQDYVPSDQFQQAAEGTVNKAASGEIEVVKFGQEKFITARFNFITSRTISDSQVIRNRPTGRDDFIAFLQYLTTKRPLEFMPDEDDTSTFEKVILESLPGSRDGIGYKLSELYGRGLPEFYDSGILTFRVVS